MRIVLISTVVVLAGYGVYVLSNGMTQREEVEKKSDDAAMIKSNEDATMNKGNTAMDKGDTMMTKPNGTMKKEEGIMMASPGSYEAYSPEKIAAKASQGNVVLFFHANWCPTCRALDADIKAHLKEIPSNLTILDVDYDNSTALKKRYGVTYQHTMVQVDNNGTLIKKWMGSPTLATFVAEVK